MLSHIVPKHVSLDPWPTLPAYDSLAHNWLEMASQASGEMFVGLAKVTHPHAVNWPDEVIHGIEQFVTLESVQQDFDNRRSLWEISAVKLEDAQKIDPITKRLTNASRVCNNAPFYKELGVVGLQEGDKDGVGVDLGRMGN